MALYVPNAGELRLLRILLKDTAKTDAFHLKLYSNNKDPGATDVAANYTECTFTGYTAQALARASWNAPTTVSNKAESSYGASPLSWTCTAAGEFTVYGYFVLDSEDNTLVWAEKFTTTRVLSNGDVLNLTPKFSLATEADV